MYTIIYTGCLGLACMAIEVLNLRKLLLPVVLLGLVFIFYVNYLDWGSTTPVVINGMDMSHMFRIDPFSVGFSGLAIFTGFMIFMMSGDYYRRDRGNVSDYLAIMLFILAGTLILFSFWNLVMIFLGIEIVSISLYIMAGSHRFEERSNEAGFKYFLMGSFASAVLLFGIALVYGATGSFQIDKIAEYAAANADSTLLQAGIILIVSALLFKVAAVPFHFWSPDVYEGAPILTTALMSTLVKVSFFAAFYRLVANSFSAAHEYAGSLLSIIAVLTMVIGNLIAINQNNFKRLLAYSGISHAGYMLLAILSIGTNSSSALLYYGTAYVLATIGAFAVAIPVVSEMRSENIDAFNGIARKNPFLALMLTISMLSLAGIPPLAGFFGKYYIFSEAIRNGYAAVTIIAILASVVGVYYYFRIILAMYGKSTITKRLTPPLLNVIVMTICALLSLLFGIFPGLLTGLL